MHESCVLIGQEQAVYQTHLQWVPVNWEVSSSKVAYTVHRTSLFHGVSGKLSML